MQNTLYKHRIPVLHAEKICPFPSPLPPPPSSSPPPPSSLPAPSPTWHQPCTLPYAMTGSWLACSSSQSGLLCHTHGTAAPKSLVSKIGEAHYRKQNTQTAIPPLLLPLTLLPLTPLPMWHHLRPLLLHLLPVTPQPLQPLQYEYLPGACSAC